MSDKTKKYKWLPWAVAVAIAIAILIIPANYLNWNWYILAPWAPARSLVTKIAIHKFKTGTVGADPHWYLRLTALGALILSFIMGPSLWVYAEIKNQSGGNENRSSLKKGLIWYMGVVLVIISLQVVPSSIIQGILFKNMAGSIAKGRNEDELRSGLYKLALDACETYYLPHNLGGAAQDFHMVPSDDGSMRSLRLTDLESYRRASPNTYQLAPVKSDSVIIIYGVGHQAGADPDFKNVDGQKGKLQLAVEVNPNQDFFHYIHKNTNGR